MKKHFGIQEGRDPNFFFNVAQETQQEQQDELLPAAIDTKITKEQDLFPWVPSWFLAAPPGSYMITHIVKTICINQQQEPMAKQNQALRNKQQQTSSPYTTTTRATTMALRRQRNAKNNKTKTRHVNYHHHQQDKEDDPRVSMFQKNYFWWHQFVATLAKQNAYVLARIFWTFASADGPTCSCRPVKLVNGTMTMKNVTSCGPHWYFRHPPVVKRCHLNRLIIMAAHQTYSLICLVLLTLMMTMTKHQRMSQP